MHHDRVNRFADKSPPALDLAQREALHVHVKRHQEAVEKPRIRRDFRLGRSEGVHLPYVPKWSLFVSRNLFKSDLKLLRQMRRRPGFRLLDA
jgi:hypothetical protein